MTVRGHEGWFVPASTDGDALQITALGWREGTGVLVTVTGFGLTEDELRAAAESLRPATDEEWDELLARGDDAPISNEDMPTLAEGPSWRYARDGDDGVCFEVVEAAGASGTCYSDGPRLSEGAEQTDEGWWFHGRVADEVAQVVLQQDGEAPQRVDTVPMDGGGRAWAALLPNGGATTLTALDAAGGEVERTTFDAGVGVERPDSTTSTMG
jgi:hypothetical protein